jgi:hypothetical protein
MGGSVLSFLKAEWKLAIFIEYLPYVSYKGSVHLVKQFQRRRFLKIDQSESSIAYGGRLSADQNEMSLWNRLAKWTETW